MLRFLNRFLFTFIVIAISAIPSLAIDEPGFEVSPALQGRVEFWKLIFSKYGKDDVVFHHRDYPEIIYSVLDFSDFRKSFGDQKYQRERNNVINRETKVIQTALQNLAKGHHAQSELEKRIETLFSSVGANNRAEYKDAAQTKQIRTQTGIKEQFIEGLKRSGRYIYAIDHVFEQANLPIILGRLPLVESSFNYKAYSSVGAAGIWQFTRSTGRMYLRVNSSIDERRDPIASTRAAARYLSRAYQKLGSWPLAITSYNHGVSGVLRAVKQTGSRDLGVIVRNYKGKTFGFASSNFYAEFIAAAYIEQNYQQFFPNLVKESPVYFDEVKLSRSTRYKDILKHSGTSESEFRALNTSLREPVILGRSKLPSGFIVKVPSGKGKALARGIGHGSNLSLEDSTQLYLAKSQTQIAKSLRAEETKYKVRRGDTLGAIARKFGVSVVSISSANNIKNPNNLQLGTIINIPGSHVTVPSSRKAEPVKKQQYKVRKGDNLSKIAQKHGISLSDLKQLNPSMGNVIHPGQKLWVP